MLFVVITPSANPMNQITDIQNLPEVVSFIPRILTTLRDMNGVAKAGAVKAAVVQAIFAIIFLDAVFAMIFLELKL